MDASWRSGLCWTPAALTIRVTGLTHGSEGPSAQPGALGLQTAPPLPHPGPAHKDREEEEPGAQMAHSDLPMGSPAAPCTAAASACHPSRAARSGLRSEGRTAVGSPTPAVTSAHPSGVF